MKSKDYFSTSDLGYSAALISLGYEVTSLDRNSSKKVLFIFKNGDEISEIESMYFSGKLKVSARNMVDNIKMLKNRIYNN